MNESNVKFQVPDDNDNNDESSALGDDDQHNNQPSHRVQAAMDERKSLAKRETRLVGRLRAYLLLFLAATAAVCGWATYKYTRSVEVDEFESRFASIAGSVSDSFHDAVERKLGALDSLSVSMTSHATESGESFPMVTLPDYETRAAGTRILAEGIYIFWLPMVKDDQRAAWEAYAYQKQMHLYQSFGAEVMLRTMQDQSFGLGPEAAPGTRRLEQAEVTPIANDFDSAMSSSRQLQDGAFQTYIPTIWNFQVCLSLLISI